MNLVSDPLWAFLETKDMRQLSLVNRQEALQVRTKLSDCKKPGICASRPQGKCKAYCERLRNKARVLKLCLSALLGPKKLRPDYPPAYGRMMVTMHGGEKISIDLSKKTVSDVRTADVKMLQHSIYKAAETKHMEDLIQAIEATHAQVKSIKIAVSVMTAKEALFELIDLGTKEWKIRERNVEVAIQLLIKLFASVPSVSVSIGRDAFRDLT